jgi:tetratricopeptide (TPR) repeat protein
MGLRTLVKRPLIWKSAIDVIVDSPDIPFSQDNLHGMRRLIGYGPDTFIITSQLKYPGLLKSIDTYRSMLLSQPENHYLFLAATTGILGWLSYLIILVIAVFSGLKIARVSTDRSTVIAVAALLAAVVQYCAHILFSPANIVPDMVFWIALSLLAVLYRLSLFKENEDKSISVIPTSVSTTRKAVATGILAVGFIVAVGLTAGPFLADIKLQQALNTWSKEKYAALARFTEATKLDRYEATYYGYLGYHTYQLAIQNTNSEEKIRLLNISLAAYDAADHLEPHLAYWHYTPADVNTYWASIGERNRWKDALYLYENANALFPGNAVILNKWALALILFGDYEEAEMKLEQSRVSDPEWDQTVYIDGFLQAETGDMQEAGSVIVNRAKSKPDSIRYFVSLCHQLAIYGKIGPVSESISNYLQIQGDEWTVYALLGIAEFYGRDIESAGSNLLKCAEVAPKEQYKLLTDLVTFLSIEDPQFNISARQIINILTGGSR